MEERGAEQRHDGQDGKDVHGEAQEQRERQEAEPSRNERALKPPKRVSA